MAFSPFSFSLLFSSISCFVYQSYLGQHASLLAYTGYPVLCICMSLERSIDFPWISMCPSRTNLGKQTNKQYFAYNTYRPTCTSSAVATWGVKGGRVPPLTAKNLPKIGKKRENIREKMGKEGKHWEKEEKSGRFFLFAPPDR